MSIGSFWHHRRFDRSEQVNGPSQDTGQTPSTSDQTPSTSPNHDQHFNSDATPVINNHTLNAFQFQDGPSVLLTPPDDGPTVHNERGAFYQFGANPTGIALSEVSRVPPRPLEQSSWRYGRDQAWKRDSSESLLSTPTDQQHSFNPNTASKRHGTIALSNFDSVLSSRRSSAVPDSILGQLEEAASERGRLNHPEGEEAQEVPASALHDQNADDAPVFLLQEEHITISNDIPPIGKWRCCECQRGHEIYRFEAGQHLISILNCLCKHRSCRSCTFQGNVRRFAPIDDAAGVASVPVLEGDGRTIRFGVICRTCGLSWRAKRVEEAKRPGLLRRKLSILPKKVNPLHKLRTTRSMIYLGISHDSRTDVGRPGSALSTSRSIFNLKSASDAQGKDAKLAEQAQGAFVRFYGIECTCGSITNASSVCFQVVDTAEVNDDGKPRGQSSVQVTETAESCSTSELEAKGYGTPTLHLKGGLHPNPLRRNPVKRSESPQG
ncbi:uncharacterized protein EKO05_0008345 [Ascochyta rabiei]|uniref:uncharacterized protein n=1 Tax=Didymella rabiei TaxID=5454 RepID=UPI001900B193|nr:uncharacterized protein EKO05_0008345 [Ascochyta rabiei]UPX18021.1 hypothetical protein EKO05_0008345 [Ascochyta rabiei]